MSDFTKLILLADGIIVGMCVWVHSFICGGRQTGKTARMMADAVKAATTGNRVLVARADGLHEIRNVTPEQPAQTRFDKMAALMEDYWEGKR